MKSTRVSRRVEGLQNAAQNGPLSAGYDLPAARSWIVVRSLRVSREDVEADRKRLGGRRCRLRVSGLSRTGSEGSLFGAKRLHRVRARGAERGDKSSYHHGAREHDRDGEKRQRVEHGNVGDEAGQHPGQ